MVRKYKLKLNHKKAKAAVRQQGAFAGGSRERARSVPPKISKRYLPEPYEQREQDDNEDPEDPGMPGHSCNYQANTQEVTLRDVERPPRVYEDEKGTYIMDGERKKRIHFTSGAHNHQANKQTVNLVLSGLTTQAKRKPRKPRAPKLKPDEEPKKEEDKTEEEKKAEGQSTAYREPGLNGPRPDPTPREQADNPNYKLNALFKLLLRGKKISNQNFKTIEKTINDIPTKTLKSTLSTILGQNPLLPGVALPSWVDFKLGDTLGSQIKKIIPNDPYKIMSAIDLTDEPEQKQTQPVQTREIVSVAPDSEARKKQLEADEEAKRRADAEAKRKEEDDKKQDETEIDTEPYQPFKLIPPEISDPALFLYLKREEAREKASVELLPDDPPPARPARPAMASAAASALDLPDMPAGPVVPGPAGPAEPAKPSKPAKAAARPLLPEYEDPDIIGLPGTSPLTEEEERAIINNIVKQMNPEPERQKILEKMSGWDLFFSDLNNTIFRPTKNRDENPTERQALLTLLKITPKDDESYLRAIARKVTPQLVVEYYNARAANPYPVPAGKSGLRDTNKAILDTMIKEISRQQDEAERARFRGYGKAKQSLMVGLYDSQIDDMMRGYPEYVGCISRDEIAGLNLPEKIGEPGHGRFGFVYNTVPSNKPTVYDGHWRAIYIDLDNDKEIDHYDSFGDPAEPDIQAQIKRLLDQFNLPYYLKWKDNRVVDQRANSNNCGYFATSFLMDRFAGKPFKDASGYSNIQAGERKARGLNKKFKYLT